MLAVNKYFNNKYNKTLLDNFINNRLNGDMFFVTGSFLDMIDAISKKEYDGTLTTSLAGGTYQTLINEIFEGSVSIEDVVNEGHVASSNGIECHKFLEYNGSFHTMTFDDTTGIMDINYTMPLKVGSGFFASSDNGTDTEDLYIVFFKDSVIGYWNSVREVTSNQVSYVAFSVTETGMGGDIELDHTDKIEYIDAINIKVTLPTQLVQ